MRWIKDECGSMIAPMFFLAACLAAGALLVFFVTRQLSSREAAAAPSRI
ncbi:UNVERIFIED_ORG: hypothetical protein GGE64_001516 [Rhizobium etli]